MDLAGLNAFIAIAETGSFSLAAERLHLTQPAVSASLPWKHSSMCACSIAWGVRSG